MKYRMKLIKCLGSLDHATVLDYGCGRGDFIELMLQMEEKPKLIYAVDSSPDMVAFIHQRFTKEIADGLVITKQCRSPSDITEIRFDKIICHNVLECIENPVDFINSFSGLMSRNATLIIAHHDFDSAIYNSAYKELSRELVHHFSDTKQAWQEHADGQMGRKIPGIIAASSFKDAATIETWRILEREFKPGNYGHLMAQMIQDVAQSFKDHEVLAHWWSDLEDKDRQQQYYFAIDLVVGVLHGN